MKRKMSWDDRIFVLLNGVFLTFIFIVMLYPLIYVFSASFSDPRAVGSGEMLLWPVRPSLRAYEYIMNYKEIWTGYANSIFYTVVGTVCNLLATLPCAYALSRKDLKIRGFVLTLFIIVMYFGGGLIPSYLNYRDFGLLNTRSIIIINGLVSSYNLIVAKTFFSNSIPWEIQEAAIIDGASDFKLFGKIILPLSAPIIVVMALYYGVGHWNSYFSALIYLRERVMYPLQMFLKEILTMGQFAETAMMGGTLSPEEYLVMVKQSETADMIKYGIIVVSTVPMMVIYPFLQKYFEKGAMVGSIKG